MKRHITFLILLVLGLLPDMATNYAGRVNTLIGTKGVGLRSGYLFPGATYPHGMVQFTPTYFCKNGGFVINQNSGGGCEHMGNFPTFPLTGKLTQSPDYIRNARINVTDERGHAGAHIKMPNSFLSAIWHFAFEILATGWRRNTAEALFNYMKHYEMQSSFTSLTIRSCLF